METQRYGNGIIIMIECYENYAIKSSLIFSYGKEIHRVVVLDIQYHYLDHFHVDLPRTNVDNVTPRVLRPTANLSAMYIQTFIESDRAVPFAKSSEMKNTNDQRRPNLQNSKIM